MDILLLTAACIVGLALGTVAVVRWGGTRTTPAPLLVPTDPPSPATTVRRFLRGLSIAMVGGALAGVSVGGTGGRLMMRIMAATSGDAAQGRLTEAEEVVGRITADGTIGFVVFAGLFGGMLGGAVYLILRRWLPGPPWTAGLLLGLLLLAFARLDPLDPGNADFDLLRPKGLAVVLIVAVFLLYGMTAASIVERLDRSWPLLSSEPRAIAAHLPLLLLVPGFFFLTIAVAALLAVFVAQQVAPVGRALRSEAADRVGHAVLGGGGLAVLAWVGAGVADILRG